MAELFLKCFWEEEQANGNVAVEAMKIVYFLIVRETKARLYATGGNLVKTEIDVWRKEITPGLDPWKLKKRWKKCDLELKWAGKGHQFEMARGGY